MDNQYKQYVKTFNDEKSYYDLHQAFGDKYLRLPYSIRVLLESAVRNCDGVSVKELDVNRISNWSTAQHENVEVQFSPARVVLQDFTGVPAVVDLAAMRDAVVAKGGDPVAVNPVCPTDLVIDHSIAVDHFREDGALQKNQDIEFHRNSERFAFLKWGATSFKNMLIVPPGNGIVHQVNLEYLARVVFVDGDVCYPDSVVGTDSHTTMINGLGVIGWGVGGIEAEAVMMGLPMSMVLPEVIGFRIFGEARDHVTSTDIVLTITKNLRSVGVVGKFVEFFGPGVKNLSIADRATISNMCPEYGATCAFFPVDDLAIQYLHVTNRDAGKINNIEGYLRAARMFYDQGDEVEYTNVVELDLASVNTCVSGPKRPHDKVDLEHMKRDFTNALTNKVGFKGYGLSEAKTKDFAEFEYNGAVHRITHGSVLIAAITSCTNTSNPSVMLGAGLLARNAVKRGMTVPSYVKTSLSPGSGVVNLYLENSGVITDLNKLGFDIVGYGCMTCIGNSGPLPTPVEEALEKSDLVCCGVLSGNRNFEGRIHSLLRANYLASPLLVIAYALAGRVDIDFETEPIQGTVFLRDIWPTRKEIHDVETTSVVPSLFSSIYSNIRGSELWESLETTNSVCFNWDASSTYIRKPPFMESVTENSDALVSNGVCLLLLGDSVTTDHISPAGSISRNSPAARYLGSKDVHPKDFNSYGSRRGNDEVMARGTFANIRLINKIAGKNGPFTKFFPTNELMDVYDASIRYAETSTPLIIIAGKDYGSGSSRDWAAKGTKLLNVKIIIAQSYERIHRSNLVNMGILPLQFEDDSTLDLINGDETFSFSAHAFKPKCAVAVKTNTGLSFNTVARIDTDAEFEYYTRGGILPFLVHKICSGK